MIAEIPPAFLLIAGALLMPFMRGRARQTYMLLLPVASALQFYFLDATFSIGLFDYTLTIGKMGPMSHLFGWLFHLALFICALFALHVQDRLQNVSAFVYAGAALGCVMAGDWITFFIFWEVMTVGSVLLVWASRSQRSFDAGLRYFAVQLVSGLVLLAGILVHIGETGETAIGYLGLESLGAILIFVGLGIKCAFPLVHNWLIDAYPESTPTGTVYLSVFSTKTAIFGLAIAFPGAQPLIWIGTVMAIFPIFYAVIENDFRRVLCYSTINQLGFMVVGIGIGTKLALNGAVSHAFADVIFKSLLFMSMGAVLHVTGKVKGTELGGLYKTMPMTGGLCIVGALAIAGFPLFSAYVTKSMVLQAALDEGHWIVWLLLLFAAAGVVEHASIKIPFFSFFGHDAGIRAKEPPWNMLAAMTLAAILCVVIGAFPDLLYRRLPYPVDYQPYTASHIVTMLQLLFFASLAVFGLMVLKLYPPELRSTNLDADWFTRRLALPALHSAARLMARSTAMLDAAAAPHTRHLIAGLLHVHGPYGVFGRTWLTGTTVLWVAALLGAYLILYHL